MNDAAKRLLIRISDTMSYPQLEPKTIGRLGAVLFGSDDADVTELRGVSSELLDTGEMPFLIAEALPLLNDPRIVNISVDGDNNDSEVMIDIDDGMTLIIHSVDIDEEFTETLEDDFDEVTDFPADDDI